MPSIPPLTEQKSLLYLARLIGALMIGLIIIGVITLDIPAPGPAAPMMTPQQEREDLTAQDRLRVKHVTQLTKDFSQAEAFEAMQGGAGTSPYNMSHNAFSQRAKTIRFAEQMDFALGNALFDKFWVSSPSSTLASDGLGPLYNARACQSCHIREGRGRPPKLGESAVSMFLRLGQPASTPAQQQAFARAATLVFPDPVYGSQLQNFAVPGLRAEGDMVIDYVYKMVTLNDGTAIELRVPSYSVDHLAFGPLDEKTTLSPRIASPLIGLGLIEQIHRADILALADPEDKNGDGISGEPQRVRSTPGGAIQLGRFGWKAANASIREQSAKALAGDIGISSPDHPTPYGDCTKQQKACLLMPQGVQPHLGPSEAPDPIVDLIGFYVQNLAVPARRDVDNPKVLAGKSLFYQSGCVSCHHPKYVTRRDAPQRAHRFQLIWPYSDFLLHDMGEGLADGQIVGQANGQEWRTPPLWGLGLTESVSGHTLFLHDGRARNLTEAIIWHGGEAEPSRQAFMAMNRDAREALIAFLKSL